MSKTASECGTHGKRRQRLYVSEVPYIDHKSIDLDGTDIRYPVGKLRYKNGSIKFNMRSHIMRGGGVWYSFICECGRCVHRLYFRNWKLACRHCHQLAYTSENRSKIDRPIDQKWKYLHKLGSDDSCPERPKWMKGHAFDKICDKIERYDRLAYARFFRNN